MLWWWGPFFDECFFKNIRIYIPSAFTNETAGGMVKQVVVSAHRLKASPTFRSWGECLVSTAGRVLDRNWFPDGHVARAGTVSWWVVLTTLLAVKTISQAPQEDGTGVGRGSLLCDRGSDVPARIPPRGKAPPNSNSLDTCDKKRENFRAREGSGLGLRGACLPLDPCSRVMVPALDPRPPRAPCVYGGAPSPLRADA